MKPARLVGVVTGIVSVVFLTVVYMQRSYLHFILPEPVFAKANFIGIFEDSANSAYRLDPANTTTSSLTVAGKVGIGTTSPATALDVVGTVDATLFTGPLTGNATTATTLQTARTLWGASFNGSANVTGGIALSGAITGATTGAFSGAVTATSFTGDLICTDCLTATEITDVYVLNTSDTMSGTLGVTGVITATGGVVGALTGHSSSDLALTGGTMSGDIVMGNGVAIGQAAGPLVEFDDTNNYLEIMGGNVGIGTTSPGYPLTINATSTDPATTVQGIYSTNAITLTANNAQTAVASFGNLTYDQGGFNATAATNRGLWGRAVATGASGTITGLAGVAGNVINSGSGTISNAYGFYAVAPTNIGGGTITDSYGLYITANTVGTNIYGIGSTIASATNRWNLYISGTADNYIAGNVGIGTTSPGQKLEVADASDPYIRVHQLSTAIGAEAGIIMQSHTTNNYLSKITGKRDGTSYGTGLSFYTTNDIVGQTLTEKMTILSNGKVGIGTTAPATALEVNGTVDATLFTGPLTGHASLDATIASPNFTGTVVIPSPFTLGGTSVTASAAELNKLDSVTTTATQLNYLNAATGTTGTAKVVFQASPTFTGTVVIPSPFTLGGTSVTANGTELNILDGVTGVTAAELTALGGITANATEINILDTVTGLTAAELTNLGAVTATAAELNTVDTASSITTLLSAKAPLASPRFTDNVTLTGTGIFSTAMGSFGPSGSNLYINPSVSADVIFNMGTGNVGIGMAAPTTPFEVGSGTTPYFAVSSTNIAANIPASTNTQHLCSTGTGWQAIKVCNGGTDYAEYYGTTPNTEAGDLVSYDPAGQFKTIKSTGAYDPNIIGAISTFPNDILGEANPELNTKPVALKGRVPVKVNLENGPIKVGDWLAASSVPGVAMKATKNSMVIGRALEDYDGSFVLSPGVDNVETLMSVPHPGDPILSRPPLPQSGVGKIMVFIELSEHITQLTLTDTGDLNIAKDQTGNYIVEKTESTFVKTTVDKVEAFAEVVVGNVRAGIIETKKLIVDGIDVAAKLSELSGRIDRQEQTIRELQTELEQVKAQQ